MNWREGSRACPGGGACAVLFPALRALRGERLGLPPSEAFRKAPPRLPLRGLPRVLFLQKRVLRDVETAGLWPS